jgi:signal transduction histidine kinase
MNQLQTIIRVSSICFSLAILPCKIIAAEITDYNWYLNLKNEIAKKDTEKFIEEISQNLFDAKDIERNDLISKYLKELAFIHIHKTKDLETATKLLIENLGLEENSSNYQNIIFTYYGLSLIFYQVDDYNASAQFLQQALDLNKKNKSEDLQILLKQHLGNVYAFMEEYEQSLAQYSEILEYAKNVRYPELEARTLKDIADVQQLQQSNNEAINTLKIALAIQRRIEDKENEAKSLYAIGLLYFKMGEHERAFDNYQVALNIWNNQTVNEEGLAQTYNAIVKYYLEKKELKNALYNANLALNNAQKSQNQSIIKDSYQLISKCYKALGAYQQAFEYQELYMALEDFLQKDKIDRSILKIQNRYLINQKQNTIDELEFNRVQKDFALEKETQSKNFIRILFFVAIIFIIAIFFFYVNQRKNSKRLEVAKIKVQEQNEQLQEVNATKDKFFSIIGHDLKGPLNSLTSFSNLLMHHTHSLSKEEIKMLATDLDKSLKNLFTLLENLLEWSRSQTGNIEFTAEKFDLNEMIQSNVSLLKKQAENKNITIEIVNQDPAIIVSHQNSINTVIRNLLSNAIKFTSEGGKIKLGVVSNDNEWIVKVADNGVGMPDGVVDKIFRIDTKHSTQGTAKEKGTGLGLILCKEFVEKNGGNIWAKSKEGKGSLFAFSIPKISEV